MVRGGGLLVGGRGSRLTERYLFFRLFFGWDGAMVG